MDYLVRVTPHAERQIRIAVEWWRVHRPEAMSPLETELLTAIRSLAAYPDRGIQIASASGVRRMLITPTTLTLVIYGVRPRAKRVEVVAIRAP